ncbi:esterase [Plantibacter flavus]|uniref:alpha/beta hydrolase n=1 Tax=Plantibacter flavus TaxID=150123 RepID=UPI003F1885DD
MDWLWDLNVIDGPLVWVLYGLSLAGLLYLFIRRARLLWYLSAIIALLVGALLAVATVWLLFDLLDLFGGPLLVGAMPWILATFAAIALAILTICWRVTWKRRVLAVVCILVFGATGAIGVNGAYGLQTTLGSMFHIPSGKAVDILRPPTTPTPDPTQPLYETWKPPADMPKVGTSGPLPAGEQIPNTKSGFAARPAQIYYPPAALVKNPPALPFVLMMMGQPGDPEAKWIGGALDAIAAENNGLAPIALVVDQLGDPSKDPLCIDGKLGNVETYITQDVIPWVNTNLHVLHGRDFWTVAGYSSGGGCALYYGAKYPDTFGNIVSISGEEYQGSDVADANLKTMFGGDQAAYDAIKPTTIMTGRNYPDTDAFFSAGTADPVYLAAMQRNAAATAAAGMVTRTFEVQGGDHGVGSLTGGLDQTLRALYPRLGLSKP